MRSRSPVVSVVARAARTLALAVLPGCAGGAADATTSPSTLAGAAPLVVTDPSHPLATMFPTVLGSNMAVWYDITQSGIASTLQSAGFKAVRWPGGSDSDLYHWQGHTLCNGYLNPASTFDAFMQSVAVPAQLDVALTLNYGSNAACTGSGDPVEAAAWVDYANNSKHYGVHWWTVGNENFGNWEYDLHTLKNDAATYASAVATGYYPKIKAKDATAQVGVVVDPGSAWDQTVLHNATFDFVEMHWYAQAPGGESDDSLTLVSPKRLTASINLLKTELSAAGKSVPIHVGELGSVYATPGKQSTSISQALFAGQVIGELVQAGIPRATWWLAYGGCGPSSSGGNFASSLYGWQSYGGYNLFGDGGGCGAPRGTVLPTARAFQLAAQFVHAGEHVYTTTVNTSLPKVRAYGASQGSGHVVMLFNLDRTAAVSVPVGIAGMTSGSSVALTTYGKAEYDQSQSSVWAGPTTSTLGAWRTSFLVTLPPWSMTVAVVTP